MQVLFGEDAAVDAVVMALDFDVGEAHHVAAVQLGEVAALLKKNKQTTTISLTKVNSLACFFFFIEFVHRPK